MISNPDRINAVSLVDEAVAGGARRKRVCIEMGINDRTYRRWTAEQEVCADGRPLSVRPTPPQKFTEQETQRVLEVCHEPDYASLPPSQIVPRLADKGEYVGSVSTFYRTLHVADEQHHRGLAKPPTARWQPTSHCAIGPNQVWSWDVSYLNSPIRGAYFKLYAILYIFNRKIVGWDVHDCEHGDYAATLMHKAVIGESCIGESWFRTCKYCPAFPTEGFESLKATRKWMMKFVHWYNEEHRHSGIRHVTPAQRHHGEDEQILANRKAVFEKAKADNPSRWSGSTRNRDRVAEV